MQGETLQNRARHRAAELPGAGWEQPFGPDWDVCKVRGKVFMLMTERSGDLIVTLKADPEEAKALQSEHADVTPGYHMNKRHWVTLHPGGSITGALVDELVTESYRLVVEKLPRAQRPIDPATFGQP